MNNDWPIFIVYIAMFLFWEKMYNSLGYFMDMFLINVLSFFNLTAIAYLEYFSGTLFNLIKDIGAFFSKYF